MKKVEHYKLKKYCFFLKVYIKMENTIIKIDDIKIPKQKFHQHRRPISIENGEIDKIVVSEKVGYKNAQKVSLYVYFYQK